MYTCTLPDLTREKTDKQRTRATALYHSQYSSYVPPGTHYCWVDRGKVRSQIWLKHSCQLWESNPQPLALQGPRVERLNHCAVHSPQQPISLFTCVHECKALIMYVIFSTYLFNQRIFILLEHLHKSFTCLAGEVFPGLHGTLKRTYTFCLCHG